MSLGLNMVPVSVRLSLAIVVLGCAPKVRPVVPEPRSSSFVEREYAGYGSPGTSSITGQAFLKTRGGDVKFGAGNQVLLSPVTSYSSEIWQKTVLKDGVLVAGDERAEAYTRSTVADGDGRFRFDSLPEGLYYVVTEIVWEVPSIKGPWLERTGGLVGQEVTVRPGQTVQVILPLVRSVEPHRIKKPAEEPRQKPPKRAQLPSQPQ